MDSDSPDLDFRGWNLAFRTYVRSVTTSDVNLLVDAAPPPPANLLEIAHLPNANARRLAEAEREVSLTWHNGQNRASASLYTAVSKNQIATNILFRQRDELVVPLAEGQNLPIREMLQALVNHFNPVNENRSRKAVDDAKAIRLKKHEPFTKFLVRLERAFSIAETQGRMFDIHERKSILDTALKTGEILVKTILIIYN